MTVQVKTLKEAGEIPEGTDLAIQCTSVGLASAKDPAAETACPVQDEAFYEKIRYAYDLIYRPARTPFLARVEQHGGRGYNGLDMLLYQGICAYELWMDVAVPEQVAEVVYGLLEKAVKV